jgi:hypothetical protein
MQNIDMSKQAVHIETLGFKGLIFFLMHGNSLLNVCKKESSCPTGLAVGSPDSYSNLNNIEGS